MSDSLRKLFHATKPHREDSDCIRVLVSLKAPADESCLASLQEIGLKVGSVEGNKLTGEIASRLVPKLEEHASVSEVERSEILKPTGDRNSGA